MSQCRLGYCCVCWRTMVNTRESCWTDNHDTKKCEKSCEETLWIPQHRWKTGVCWLCKLQLLTVTLDGHKWAEPWQGYNPTVGSLGGFCSCPFYIRDSIFIKRKKRNKWHKLSGNCSAKGTSSNLALGMCPLIFYIHHIKDIYKTERVSGILPFFKIVIKYHLTIIPQLKLFFTLLVPLNETHYFIWGEKYSTSKSLIAISSGTDQFSVDVPGTRIMQIMTHSRYSFGIYKSKIVNWHIAVTHCSDIA